MQRGISIDQLKQAILTNMRDKEDFIADTRNLTVEAANAGASHYMHVTEKNVDGDINHGTFRINDLAHRQIGEKLGIPAGYYDRMRREQPEMLARDINTWHRAEPKGRMIRTLGPVMRSYLSDRFRRLDHELISGAALPELEQTEGVTIRSSHLTETRLYIQAVLPRVQGEVREGDVVQAGVAISNSEVGMGRFVVAPMWWRCWCDNGAIRLDQKGSSMHAQHIGKRLEDNEALYADDTRQADNKAVMLKIRDSIRNAFWQVAFDASIGKLRVLTETPITGNPIKVVEKLAKSIRATDEEHGAILRALTEGSDLTAWGLVNAVTYQAHGASSYDRAVNFDNAGGALINLPESEWKPILEAA